MESTAQAKRIENAKTWAESLRICTGSVEVTHQDGEIQAIATKSGVIVLIDGVNHASDCNIWVAEPCNCVTARDLQ